MSATVAAAGLDRAHADLRARVARRSGGEAEIVAGLEPFGDGHSGFTYRTEIAVAGKRRPCVLRLSPPGARIAGPADIGRQGEIMASLRGTGVPVPEVFDCSSEPEIDGRAFMLTELVAAEGAAQAARSLGAEAVAREAIEVLRSLRSAPVGGARAVSDAEEVGRWTALLPRTPEFVRGPCERLAAALGASPARATGVSRVHGDFHYGNLLFRDGRVVAVLDWEISSVGSPYADLGSLVVASIRRAYAPDPNSMVDLAVDPAALAALHGGDPEPVAWHAACACLKYAAIIGFNYELHRSGRREDPEYALLEATMRGLPADGLRILRGGLL